MVLSSYLITSGNKWMMYANLLSPNRKASQLYSGREIGGNVCQP